MGVLAATILHLSLSAVCLPRTKRAGSGPAAVQLVRRKAEPYGIPRPGPEEKNVPLRTSFYIELQLGPGAAADDRLLAESVAVRLSDPDGRSRALLGPGCKLAADCRGELFFRAEGEGRITLCIYLDPEKPLRPGTTYAIDVSARSARGARLLPEKSRWRFTTEPSPEEHKAQFSIKLTTEPVRWHGGFFTGFCKPSFCTSVPHRVESDQLMDQLRRWSPKAWSLERSAWLTGTDMTPSLLPRNLPGVVREMETRRIVKLERTGSEPDIEKQRVTLYVEDFFGHEQYGVSAGRPLSDDYHPGDVVLIADHQHSVRAKVLSVDDQAGKVTVTAFADPPGGWQIGYFSPPPKRQNPDAPGLFALGGCYLRKFKPPGTPRYFWRRLDYEWDLQHRKHGRRLIVNFVDTPIDLAVDGRPWTVPKDYAEFHQVVYTIAGHVIDRYGEAATEFYWSVFNEPDLRPVFWRADWNELQKFYDYAVDAVLRAFEDRGYDSRRVKVGGLELGAIFGTHLKLREFLAHCSPRAEAKGAVERNAAFADRRLDGKRSRRVEQLCRANGGRGSPCDFISIHAYNRSDTMAAKLIRAKQMALELDEEFFRHLWINSHESCPSWSPPPDPAAADSYRGNGYFTTWCADVARRLLARAAADPRYGFGETILTFWPAPNRALQGLNAATRILDVDEDGDGQSDRTVCVAMPILHFLGLLNAMGDRFWVLPEKQIGGHVLSGFAARTRDDLRLLLYSHHPLDTQSRSQRSFLVQLELGPVHWPVVEVCEYRYDKEHNSYFRLARQLLDRSANQRELSDLVELSGAILTALAGSDKRGQLAALTQLAKLGPPARPLLGFVAALASRTQDKEVRSAAFKAALVMAGREAYPPGIVEQIRKLSQLTVSARHKVHVSQPANRLRLRIRVAANGANHLIIRSAESSKH